MRVYFLSCTPAALRLNGMYIGTVDGFERHIELNPSDSVFAEITPGDNLHGVNFFLDEKFFSCPPSFADLYLAENDAFVYIREYAPKDVNIEVIYQTRFLGNLITVFKQGGVYLSAEGREFDLSPLPSTFSNVTAEVKTLAGMEVLAVYGGKYLLIISGSGEKIFLNAVEDAEFGATLKTVTPFETCTASKAECEYSYDGDKLTLTAGRTVETYAPGEDVMHFAFFESVLTRGDYKKYLDGELAEKAGVLKEYLGDFIAVTVPPEKFFALHGDIKSAGLVYPKNKNLFEIKYFAVDVRDGKISNIYPAE